MSAISMCLSPTGGALCSRTGPTLSLTTSPPPSSRGPFPHLLGPMARPWMLAPIRSAIPTHEGSIPARGGARGLAQLAASATPSIDAASQERQQQPQPQQPQQPKPRPRSRKQQQQRRTPGVVQDDAVLFVGFHPEELELVRQRLPEVLPPPSAGYGTEGAAAAATSVVDVTLGMLSYTVRDVLDRASAEAAAAASGGDAGGDCSAVSSGRVVLLVGPAAEGVGAQLNDLLVEWGVVPALVAAYQPKHEGLTLRELMAFLRDAHARYYGLLQPVRVEPLEATADGGSGGADDDDHLAVLDEVRVVLTAAMDSGEVPSIHGHYRPDAGHLVVLDGLLTEGERQQLLGWLTAPDHDHGGPPPEAKWEMACVDREGDRTTWGLQPEVLQALRDDPPPPVVALQTRLAALYPEYDICHMPANEISEGAAADGDDTLLSSFVGNAVMPGDPCAWHQDADPTTVPPHSPWVHNYGYYHNRELSRPLFVSALLYLNDTWPEDYHAETLFLDPETQLGLFVRPAPGRVVLLEQDVPHRISAPSREAPGPRYSLVWKLVLVPREQPGGDEVQGQEVQGPGGQGQEAQGKGEQEQGGQGKGGQGNGGQEQAAFQSICRPEWGEPVRIGSANGRSGVRAYPRGRGRT